MSFHPLKTATMVFFGMIFVLTVAAGILYAGFWVTGGSDGGFIVSLVVALAWCFAAGVYGAAVSAE